MICLDVIFVAFILLGLPSFVDLCMILIWENFKTLLFRTTLLFLFFLLIFLLHMLQLLQLSHHPCYTIFLFVCLFLQFLFSFLFSIFFYCYILKLILNSANSHQLLSSSKAFFISLTVFFYL